MSGEWAILLGVLGFLYIVGFALLVRSNKDQEPKRRNEVDEVGGRIPGINPYIMVRSNPDEDDEAA